MLSFPKKKKVLLLIETSRSLGRQSIQGILRFVAERRNWNLLFHDRGVLEHLPVWLKHWDGDGIISRTDTPEKYRQLRKLQIPVIEILGDGKRHPPHVKCDEIQSCRLVADHFWQRSFRSFGFFSIGHNWWVIERQKAFQQALAAYGAKCAVSPQTAIKNDISSSFLWWKGCDNEVSDWVRSLPKPVGIFCPWDMQAFFLMNICESQQIAIPEDVAVVGYGNNADICRASTPPLSSVAPNAQEYGYQAAVLLDRVFQGKTLPDLPISIPATHLQVRQSSDIVAVPDPDVAAAIHFIRKNIDRKPISVTDVARHLNLSKSTLARRFRDHLGRPPEVEILHAKIELAKELLRETRFSMGKIAVTLGYSSTANFVRAFHRHTELTPQAYRLHFLGEET